MFDLPLSEASLSEVLARVTHAYILLRHSQIGMEHPSSHEFMRRLYVELEEAGLETISTWILAYNRQWAPLFPLSLIRQNFILDARRGCSWRRVAYPYYKRNR